MNAVDRRSTASVPAMRMPGGFRKIANIAGKAIVVAAVVWHMFAIAVFAVPSDAKDRFATFTQSRLMPVVSDYILFTSQWQQWNLFAPDPIRRITYYRFSKATPDGWEEVVTLQPGSYPWWTHANHFKLLLGVMEGAGPDVAERFVQLLCTEYGMEPGSLVKMGYIVSVVPWTSTPQDYQTWRAWNYPFSEEGSFNTTCSDPPLPLP